MISTFWKHLQVIYSLLIFFRHLICYDIGYPIFRWFLKHSGQLHWLHNLCWWCRSPVQPIWWIFPIDFWGWRHHSPQWTWWSMRNKVNKGSYWASNDENHRCSMSSFCGHWLEQPYRGPDSIIDHDVRRDGQGRGSLWQVVRFPSSYARLQAFWFSAKYTVFSIFCRSLSWRRYRWVTKRLFYWK